MGELVMVGLEIGKINRYQEGCRGAQLPALPWEGRDPLAGRMGEDAMAWIA